MTSLRYQSAILSFFLALLLGGTSGAPRRSTSPLTPRLPRRTPTVASTSSKGGSCPVGKYYDPIVRSCQRCEDICDPARRTESDCQEHIHACQETLQRLSRSLPVPQAVVIETKASRTVLPVAVLDGTTEQLLGQGKQDSGPTALLMVATTVGIGTIIIIIIVVIVSIRRNRRDSRLGVHPRRHGRCFICYSTKIRKGPIYKLPIQDTNGAGTQLGSLILTSRGDVYDVMPTPNSSV